ncbi:hypothetical protein ISF_09012 [Cordyceps fumosorosea ARSEF 2679]|uniref:Extracellular protein n=1 Tax=Cordyceps fumosorosea (strain ARSEF 2679) TaxID=1081104 RepID=A0A167LJS5_CORFA|nr:hypothetical protein ISF_09012 [Cordyceps fumosorosea ARSEF 2679]OAA53171.1 hypothetical protein ISF_09012 [Cordyceps fumosorosea ARSEF 2679]
MKAALAALTVLCLGELSSAHMQMSWPPPFRSKYNPYTTSVDYNMNSPLDANGDNFPCKGYQSLLGTPQGQSVVTWQPGQSYNMTIVGGATHGGGSCQASLSYDRGATWTVVHSYIGGCPLTANWVFTLPNDTPTGDTVLFAWSWFNKIGNREMYMNCAHVTIAGGGGGGGGGSNSKRDAGDAFASRPAMFVANVNNGCGTSEGCDVDFPEPGPDVDNISSKTCPPVGNCS